MAATVPKLLPTPEAATMLGLRPQTLRKWRHQGVGPRFIRLGNGPAARVAYAEEEIRAWLAARSFTSTAEETVLAARRRSAE